MREMKDSGIEWIGEIPKDWVCCKVKNATSFVGSGTTPTSSNQEFYDGDISWIQSGDLYKAVAVESVEKKLTLKALKSFSALHIYQAPFIVMAMYGASVGNTAFSKIDACCNQACCCIKNNEFFNLNFMYYWLILAQIDFLGRAIGGTQPNISQEKIRNQHIVKPSLEEQQQVADYLDTKCSEIDATAEDIQKQIAILEDYKKSVITEAVTKGLNPDAEMKDSGIEWVGKIPKHWSVMHNKYIMTKEKTIKEIYSGEDIISLSMNGVIVRDLDAGGKMPKTFDGYQIVHPGNLLMCLFDYDVTPRCIGLIKNFGVTSPAYSQFVMNKNNYPGYYYYYYLMVDYTKAILHLAKNLRHSFTEEQLGSISAPVPPIEEQVAIEKILDQKCSEIDSLISDKKKQLEILAEYKKSLIYEYATGKKEILEQA